MTNPFSDWDDDDLIDAGLVDVDDCIPPELKDQRRIEIVEILRMMESRISSGNFDQSVDPDFFCRKKQLEEELYHLDF
jgi:hypothetical protein